MGATEHQIPGLARSVITHALYFVVFLLVTTIVTAMFSGLFIAGVYYVEPGLAGYVIIAAFAWITVGSIERAHLIIYRDQIELPDFNLTLTDLPLFLVFAMIFVSAIVGIGGGLAYLVASVTGLKAAAIVVAVLYPILDVQLLAKELAPELFLIDGLLAILHRFGILTTISSSIIRELFVPHSFNKQTLA